MLGVPKDSEPPLIDLLPLHSLVAIQVFGLLLVVQAKVMLVGYVPEAGVGVRVTEGAVDVIVTVEVLVAELKPALGHVMVYE